MKALEEKRSTRVFEAYVPGLASAVIYDHSGHVTTIGRYQIVKTKAQGKRRQSICYRHQRPAAVRMAKQFLAQFGEATVRVEVEASA